MLELYCHPLASFCWKVLIALYEHGIPFTARIIDLSDPAQRAELVALSPFGKFPLLHDKDRGEVVLESTIILEYLARHHAPALLPPEHDLAVRYADRFYDLYVQLPMQSIVGDRLRPADKRDPLGVEQARATLRTAYAQIEREMATRAWAIGDAFTLADCAAAPALFYADQVEPLADEHAHAKGYLARLKTRPGFARVLREAEPYFANFPGGLRR